MHGEGGAKTVSYEKGRGVPWVHEHSHDGMPVRDVVVIGAGMCGLAATAKLVLSGITNVVAYDAAPAGLEGPWVTFARMQTLRSPKSLNGPSLGLPQLTFRAWFTAQWGAEAWQSLDKIPRGQWMDYLVWYRKGARSAGAQHCAHDRHCARR